MHIAYNIVRMQQQYDIILCTVNIVRYGAPRGTVQLNIILIDFTLYACIHNVAVFIFPTISWSDDNRRQRIELIVQAT